MPVARVVALASGSGSLLQALLDSAHGIGVEVVLVITDRQAQAEQRAGAQQRNGGAGTSQQGSAREGHDGMSCGQAFTSGQPPLSSGRNA